MKTFKLTYETMDGAKRTATIKAVTLDEATTELCRTYRVANILAASVSGQRIW